MNKISSFADLPRHMGFPRLRREGLYSIVLFVGCGGGNRTVVDLLPAILFGWAFPVASAPPLNKWYGNRFSFEKVAGEHECGISRVSCYLSSVSAMRFADLMANGGSLAEASAAVGISDPPNELRELRLSGVTSGHRIFQPPIILRASDVASRLVGYLRPGSSSVSDAVAYSASTRLLSKRRLVETLAPGANAEVERSVWIWIGKTLLAETGLDFTRNDAGRMGDFEVLDFPAADAYGRSAIGWSCVIVNELSGERRNHSIEVRIRRTPETVFGEKLDAVYIACQLGTDNDIASDEIRSSTFDGDTLVERFESPTEICNVGVRIWAARGDSVELLYEDHKPLVRVVQSDIGVVGAAGQVKGGWSKHPKTGSKDMAEVEQFRRVFFESTAVGGYEKDPWVPVARAQRELMTRLLPDASGARFFPVGWETDLADWLKKLTESVNVGSLLLVDPYFDQDALIHTFARAGSADCEYTVLTEFNHRGRRAMGGRTARKRVVSACERMRAILPPHFRMLEISPGGSSKRRVIHDRVIILKSRSGEPLNVFSLTNSLQGSTRRQPMLAVPVSGDVLPDVLLHVEQILAGKPGPDSSARVERIWPADRSVTRSVGTVRPTNFRVVAEFLLRRMLIPRRFRTEDTAKAALQEAGIYDPEADRFKAHAVKQRLDKIGVKARATSTAWSAISEVSVRMEDEAGFSTLDSLVLPMGEPGFDLPRRVIEEAAVQASPLGIADTEWTAEDLSIARGAQVPFGEALSLAGNLLADPHEFRGATPWPFVQAIRYLIRRRPERIVSAFDALVQGYRRTLDGDSATPASGPWACAISLAVKNIAASLWFERDTAVRHLMRSSVPLLRALGAEAWINGFHEAGTPEPPSSVYLELPEVERVLVLARAAHLLRAHSARLSKGSGSSVDVKSLDSKLRLLQPLLLENWPRSPTQEVLREIAHALSGPLEGAEAPELYRTFGQAAGRAGFDMQLGTRLLLKILIEKLQVFVGGDLAGGFYLPVDGPLTLVCSEALSGLDVKARGEHFDRLVRVGDVFLGRLRTPFFRSREYGLWSSAADGAIWLIAYFDAIEGAHKSRGEPLPARLEHSRSELLSTLRLLPDEGELGSLWIGFVTLLRKRVKLAAS
jgi:hypothetical protein